MSNNSTNNLFLSLFTLSLVHTVSKYVLPVTVTYIRLAISHQSTEPKIIKETEATFDLFAPFLSASLYVTKRGAY